MGEFIQIAHPDGERQEAYLALPPSGQGPAILLLGEIYNVNAWVRAVADRYAAEGFVVLAPDLFWRDEATVYMDYTPENQQRGRAFYARMDADQVAGDLDAAIRHLRADPRVTGKITAIGFCLGGQLAVLAGARSNPDAIIVYYGTDLHKFMDEIAALRQPALFHFGAEDKLIPLEIAHEISRRTAAHGTVETHVYEGAGHGFARFGHPPHEPKADALATARNLDLLKRL
ncbi:dienelactone hydrolase family protein [Aquabacter cavernae]|uniref:dienelactone hydrolase family protein n=1 Tax=Aquabacter cavernae TaxID=2496029 RepID=UPI000F8CEE5C|nr:dienelactone hydrolase family protein [Aquabacter cavernae]